MPKATQKLKKKAANGYKLPKQLCNGEVLEDVAKKKWKLGPSIGQGSFGNIYSAQEVDTAGAKYPYAIKIEPHENEQFLVEMNFYIKFAVQEDVEAFKTKKSLNTFGMPIYVGSGSQEYNGEKYNFIVMEKFGTDLMKIFNEHNKHFPTSTVFKIAIQILDILEYIHEQGYIHSDIKASNIVMGVTKETQNKQVYLIDFGLATKCDEENEFKLDPKTSCEYLSRDAHNGEQTKKGDLEMLAYNIIQWLGCVLPWQNLKDPSEVQKSKEEYMSSIFKLIKACFDKRSPPGAIVDFLNYLSTINQDSNPDYKNIRKIFLSGLDPGDGLGKPLQFTLPEKSPSKKSPVKRKNNAVTKTPPKKRQAKKQLVTEQSEDEKENFDEDDHVESDIEEELSSNINKKRGGASKAIKDTKTKKKTNQKKTKQETNGNPSMAEDMDSNFEEQNQDEVDQASEAIEENQKPKGKRKIGKKASKEENIDHISDNDEINTKDTEEIVKVDKGRKKTEKQKGSKSTKKKADEDEKIVSEISTRTRGGRGKFVNYREDSDDEKKPLRGKAKNPPTSTELHVTGDSSNEVTKNVQNKKKRGTKKNADTDDESAVANSSDEPPKKERKKRPAKNKENV